MNDQVKIQNSKGKSSAPRYMPSDIEGKWRKKWQEERLYRFRIHDSRFKNKDAKGSKEVYYTLVELPYPSGDLHIGHWFTFIAPDVLSRFLTMQGKDVFFPMGYDAFGLPAENAAIKRGVHPQDWTLKNIETMTAQFETMGTMIDWDHLTITCLPEYYKWNQWIFQKMYEKGIAYRGKTLSNWCPTDQTVLANEHVENGKCWRCGDTVIQKEVAQWFLKITDYAEKLLWNKDGNGVDWPNSVMTAQNEWIGKKEGIEITYDIENTGEKVTIFTTRPDTNYGAAFIAIAPEHPLVKKITTPDQKETVDAYVKAASEKTELERKEEGKEKTGAFTGVYAVNHLTGYKMPIYVSDFVLVNFGTGALVGVPGHDLRDFQFAQKFGLEIKRVVVGSDGDTSPITKVEQVQEEEGTMINSDFLNGMDIHAATQKIMDYMEKKGWGKRVTTYHLHDWSVSRQRYWGTPVPMIHCEKCGMVPVPEDQLPVELPYNVDYQPKGKPPLASNEGWLRVQCPKCGGEAERDPETLDTFFDSSWYYYRYVDPQYTKGPFDPVQIKEFMPVDIYFGGGEHTLGHTLYARFFTKFFKDLGLVEFNEFAKKRVQHGIVLGPDGNKMSKSKGNVINPDEVVKEFGTDAVRVYLSFMMPYQATGPWAPGAMYGSFRFLKRVWELKEKIQDSRFKINEGVTGVEGPGMTGKDLYEMHRTIKKVTDDLSDSRNNTAVAALMEWLNFLEGKVNTGSGILSLEEYQTFLLLLAPIAPHMTEELWQNISIQDAGDKIQEKNRESRIVNPESFNSIHQQPWPVFDSKYLVADTVVVAVQINGKLRETIEIQNEKIKDQKAVESAAQESDKVQKHLEGKEVKKVIYVPGKILNFVVV